MKFCTVINCMDGRVQEPVIKYMKERFQADCVDSITEPGPNGILAEKTNQPIIENILLRTDISVNKHKSDALAIIGHHDCAGNPVSKSRQIEQVRQSMKYIGEHFPNITIIGLWVDENWQVQELD